MRLLIAASLSLVLAACNLPGAIGLVTDFPQIRVTAPPATEILTSDFVPPSGADPDVPHDETPGTFRILTATSGDGIHFTRTHRIITDQGGAPDMVIDSSGRIYLYYMGWESATNRNQTNVAISSDQGTTWIYKHLQFSGGAQDPVDPDVVMQGSHFVMYGTEGVSSSPTVVGIGQYMSPDGIHFGRVGTTFSVDSSHPALDSQTFEVGGLWHLLTLQSSGTTHSYATSTDGRTFTSAGTQDFVDSATGNVYFMGNGLAEGSSYRMYGFSRSEIRPATSTDGVNWTFEDVSLSFDSTNTQERDIIRDPAVVKRLDGSYFMCYTAKIP